MKIRQKAVPFVGPMVDALYTSLPVLSIINFLSIAVVLYNEIRPYLLEHAAWVKLWMFMLSIFGLTVVIMVVVYKFVIPSLWAFRSKQIFHEENEIKVSLEILLEKQGVDKEEVKRRLYESRNNSTNKDAN